MPDSLQLDLRAIHPMPDLTELRETCAERLLAAAGRIRQFRGFVGLDGFVDDIVHVVDKRDSATAFVRVKTIAELGRRIGAAAGHSTNIELVSQRTKLGGNGPIMANALAHLGIQTTYVGALGFPNIHPVFADFAARADVHSIAEAGHTDALEFSDGKIMLTKTTQLNDVTWEAIQQRYGQEAFLEKFSTADLVAFVNWTMVPHMNRLWTKLLEAFQPPPAPRARTIFFDLADPEKRTRKDILLALEIIKRFENHFEIILGLNEKEALEIAEVLGLSTSEPTPQRLIALTVELQARIGVATLVVHPVSWALAVTSGHASTLHGPFIAKPQITTGAGDHFNAGFCLGKLLGFDNTLSLLTGVAASGFYVCNAATPTVEDLAALLRDWPESQAQES